MAMVNGNDNGYFHLPPDNVLRVLDKSDFILKIISLFIVHLSILLYTGIKGISFFDIFAAHFKKINDMNKVWFITGSSRGLGKSLTEAVLANGDNVAATARNPERLSDLVKKYPNQIIALPVDVTNKEQIDKAVKDTIGKFGCIDVLVNNAGVGITGAIEEFSNEQMDSQLQINLHGTDRCYPICPCLTCVSNVQVASSMLVLSVDELAQLVFQCTKLQNLVYRDLPKF